MPQKVLERPLVFGANADDLGPNKIFLGRYVYAHLLITPAQNLKSYPPAQQIKLKIKKAFLADQILFLDAYRRNDKGDTRCAYINSFARQELVVP